MTISKTFTESTIERLAESQQVLVQVQQQQIELLKRMDENMSKLNDSNILHHEQTIIEHKNIADKLKELTAKYWYLIIFAFIILAILAGVEQASSLLKPV